MVFALSPFHSLREKIERKITPILAGRKSGKALKVLL